MEIVTINGEEYQQTYNENGHRVWIQDKNKRGFKTKMVMSGTEEQEKDFKQFVINTVSKKY